MILRSKLKVHIYLCIKKIKRLCLSKRWHRTKIFLLIGSILILSGCSGKIKGRVVNSKGKPVRYATVIVEKDNSVISRIQTDKHGKYEVKEIKQGKYTIYTSKNGHYSRVSAVKVSPLSTSKIDLILDIRKDTPRRKQVNIKKVLRGVVIAIGVIIIGVIIRKLGIPIKSIYIGAIFGFISALIGSIIITPTSLLLTSLIIMSCSIIGSMAAFKKSSDKFRFRILDLAIAVYSGFFIFWVFGWEFKNIQEWIIRWVIFCLFISIINGIRKKSYRELVVNMLIGGIFFGSVSILISRFLGNSRYRFILFFAGIGFLAGEERRKEIANLISGLIAGIIVYWMLSNGLVNSTFKLVSIFINDSAVLSQISYGIVYAIFGAILWMSIEFSENIVPGASSKKMDSIKQWAVDIFFYLFNKIILKYIFVKMNTLLKVSSKENYIQKEQLKEINRLEKYSRLVNRIVIQSPELFLKGSQSFEDIIKLFAKNYSNLNATHKISSKLFSSKALTIMAREYTNMGKYETTVQLLIKKENSEYVDSDWELLYSCYEKLGKLNELDFSQASIRYGHKYASSLLDEKRYKEALRVIDQIPEEKWGPIDYHISFVSYVNLGVNDLAEEMFRKISKERKFDDILDLYYDMARLYEQTNKIKEAIEIYKEFITHNVVFKDVFERYKELKKPPHIHKAPVPSDSLFEGAERQTISTQSSVSEGTELIAGKYEIIREIGRGGMGIVYEGINRILNKKVALKKMRDELNINFEEKKKFIEEAKTIAQLRHPYIVDIYDVIEDGGKVYLVFEFIDGRELSKIIADEGIFNYKKSLDIGEKVCEALNYAHSRGVVHRDLKPANIMLEKNGNVRVLDFGIARIVKNTLSKISERDSKMAGTLAYMAPEQYYGEFDRRSDIYSFGITLYELVTDELPFKGPNFKYEKEKMLYKLPSEILSDAIKDFDGIIKKCFETDFKKRYNSIEELLRDLREVNKNLQ